MFRPRKTESFRSLKESIDKNKNNEQDRAKETQDWLTNIEPSDKSSRSLSPKSTRSTSNPSPFLHSWDEAELNRRLEVSPELAGITADQYAGFAEGLLEDAAWWLEYRLIYKKFASITKDFFKDLIDDPDEGLPGYGFLTEERNHQLVRVGCNDILENYSKIESAKQPQRNVSRGVKVRTVNLEANRGNKTDQQAFCDRISRLLIEAGYRPDPNWNRERELEKGEYPAPFQYYRDMDAFLELIICSILVTCPMVPDYEDIVGLRFANPE
ncbi:hypothetical protein ABW19_dt0201669 [Dactylella cylindrospora]|nr:hypothetical protein ABW19_dt0201669 [Dactylella cylindrospora]